jgi:chorismate mutase
MMEDVQITPEQLAKDREQALERVRLEINALDTEIADLLLQRLAKGRYARYLHPSLDTDDVRQKQIVARYTKRLTPWTSASVVEALCYALFRMSMP